METIPPVPIVLPFSTQGQGRIREKDGTFHMILHGTFSSFSELPLTGPGMHTTFFVTEVKRNCQSKKGGT
jgi:hypothetical protein